MADQTPILLACDTTQSACSVAVKIGAAEARQNMLEMARGHAEALMPLMQDFMAAEGLAMADLTHLAVTVGPGTFTGTRVGLSAMRGLALALNLPLVGIGSLQAMALASDAPRPRLVAIDARRDSFYCQAFSVEGRILSPPQALGLSDAAALIGGQQQVTVIGTGKSALAALDARFLPDVAPDVPQARYVAALAAQLPAEQWQAPPPAPLYLRPPDATLPDKSKALLRAP